jgi:iron complex outermembrane receptor protein
MRNCFIILIYFCISDSYTFPQSAVKGRVYDRNTLENLHGVYVIYEKNKGTITDIDGTYFFISNLRHTDITYQFIGYKPYTVALDLIPDDTVEMDIGLELEIKEIGQIVVSANKTEQKVAELTVSMDILKQTDFTKNHITDPEELVNKTSGIEILDGQASIRGGTGFSYGAGSRVLALIDGLPVLSPDAGNIKWQFLPLENISQIEIIKGASSVLYGSQALNGVINFRTADASETPQTRFFAETGIYDRPRNRNWIWWKTPRLHYTGSFSHLRKIGNNDFGLGLNLMKDNSYRKYNNETLGRLSFRLKHHNSKHEGLNYGINMNAGYTSKTDFILWEDAEYGALKQDTSSVSSLHGSFLAIDPFINYNMGNLKHDLRIRFQLNNNQFPVRKQNNSNATALYSEYTINYILNDYINMIAGIAGNFSKISSALYGDHEGSNIAGFTQFEASPLRKLKIVAGVRLEANSLDGINDKPVPVFRTGINWQAGSYTFIRGSFGQGYRFPSVAEKYAYTTLGSVRIFPNPYVNAESGWSSEIGIKQGVSAGTIRGQADFSLFFSQNKDLIEYVFGNYFDPLTGIQNLGFMATNVEQSRIYGYEAEFLLEESAGQVSTTINAGYTFIYPVEFNSYTHRNTGAFLKYRRKHTLKLSGSARYRKLEAGLSFYAKSKILGIDDVFLNPLTREAILPGFFGYWQADNKGYLLLDGNLGCNFTPVLNLSFAVKNLTNTEYMGRPGDIQPQRNYSLRLSGKF